LKGHGAVNQQEGLETSPPIEPSQKGRSDDFHPWRLLGALAMVLLGLAGIAALVDFLVLGW